MIRAAEDHQHRGIWGETLPYRIGARDVPMQQDVAILAHRENHGDVVGGQSIGSRTDQGAQRVAPDELMENFRSFLSKVLGDVHVEKAVATLGLRTVCHNVSARSGLAPAYLRLRMTHIGQLRPFIPTGSSDRT